jgi:hypothetical protein
LVSFAVLSFPRFEKPGGRLGALRIGGNGQFVQQVREVKPLLFTGL